MNIGFELKVKEELRNAYRYFGETDETIIEERASQSLDELKCIMIGSEPERIMTDRGKKVGYFTDVALTVIKYNQIKAVRMLVYKNNIEYILNEYETVKDENWKYGDDIVVKNETNKCIKLSDVDPKDFA